MPKVPSGLKREKSMDVEDVIRKFRESESSISTRKGAFRIDSPFEESIKKILKAKPEPKPSKAKKKQRHNP